MRSCSPVVRTALVVFACTVSSTLAHPQEPEGRPTARQTLIGTIELPPDMDRDPASIQVSIDVGDYHENGTPTPAGTFSFREVPRGDLVLEVRSPGFEITRTEIRAWTGTDPVAVPLGKAIGDEAAQTPAGSPVVSIQTLKVPEKAIKLAARGQEESDKKNLEKAADLLHKAVQICPTFVEAWNNLGVTYLRMGKQKEAESALVRALDSDPKAAPALRNLGLIYLQTKRPNEALAVLLRAREAAREKDLYIETYLGHALYGTGQYQEAEAVLKGAIRMKPDFPAALYPLALAQVKLREYADAKETFTRFLRESGKGQEAEVARSVLAKLDNALRDEGPKTAE